MSKETLAMVCCAIIGFIIISYTYFYDNYKDSNANIKTQMLLSHEENMALIIANAANPWHTSCIVGWGANKDCKK